MIVYLEGPDGSGKSTLLKEIHKSLTNMFENKIYVYDNSNLLIPTHPKLGAERITEPLLYKRLKSMVHDNSIHLVDRGPISDLVYRVFDNYTSVTNINKFKAFLEENDKRIFTIYCNSTLAEEKMKERGDDNPVALNKHKELSKLYDLIMSVISVKLKNYAKFDYSNRNAIKNILEQIEYFSYMTVRL